jgi:transcriptional regulator with PAS, ATPase and Fis domain
MGNAFDTLELIKNTESTVLLEGETGTGKELLAAAIHYNSPRKDKMFIIQNCSTFSDTLLSSELFGHEKGSFTGAIREKKGLFEIADEGTLFLDEVGDMSREVQGRLLRVLENGTFYRVGGVEQKRVDVRILAATNKELRKQVEKGLFREDLFYRINTIRINIPPLRDRKEDILPLFHHFFESYCKIRNMEKKEINSDVFKLIMDHNWPGNIRELKNLVEHLIALSGKNETIEPKHLPMEILVNSSSKISAGNRKIASELKNSLHFFEKNIIEEVLKRVKCNKTITSRELGISRATLNNKIEKFSINLHSLSAACHSDTASQ